MTASAEPGLAAAPASARGRSGEAFPPLEIRALTERFAREGAEAGAAWEAFQVRFLEVGRDRSQVGVALRSFVASWAQYLTERAAEARE
jgi:hypothetical protein